MRRTIMSILTAAALTCIATAQEQSFEGWLTGMLQQYPSARLLDVYKSCFQDYMGAEHLVSDTAAARAYLEQELSTTRADEMQPWYHEPCGNHGNHVRVSLRAVHEGIISADLLLEAFIASAGPGHPEVEAWTSRWHELLSVIDSMDLHLPHYEQDKFEIEQVLGQGHYAISHSPEYRAAYKPHYRIVTRDIYDQRIKPLLESHPRPVDEEHPR